MFTVEDVEGQIKRTLVSGLSDAIAESKIPALDLAANYEELSQYALKALNPKVEALGLSLTSFVIENISLPEEVEKSIDKRTSMLKIQADVYCGTLCANVSCRGTTEPAPRLQAPVPDGTVTDVGIFAEKAPFPYGRSALCIGRNARENVLKNPYPSCYQTDESVDPNEQF